MDDATRKAKSDAQPETDGAAAKPARAKIARKSVSKLVLRDPDITPKVVIVGRGEHAERTPYLIRLRPEVVEELRLVVTGPTYLAVEFAIRQFLEQMSKVEGVKAVLASEM